MALTMSSSQRAGTRKPGAQTRLYLGDHARIGHQRRSPDDAESIAAPLPCIEGPVAAPGKTERGPQDENQARSHKIRFTILPGT